MLRYATALAFVAAAAQAQQPATCDLFCHWRLAVGAEAAGNYAEHLSHVKAVAALAPSHPGIVYALARAYVRAAQPDSAIATLDRLGRMGDHHDPDADSAFRSVQTHRDYIGTRNRLLANRRPGLHGKAAFEIADPDYLPEALAFDSTRSRFLIGSLTHRSVSAFAPNGTATPFVASAPGMLRVVGVHMDARRHRLWFATWAPDSTARADSAEPPSITRLFMAELPTGRVVKSWMPDARRPGHLLNDFVVMTDGALFITDTETGSIYRLRSPDDTLELFLRPDPVHYAVANGITASPDGRTLYVAYLQGIARVDVGSRKIALLPSPDSVNTSSNDGLYWYRGSLIGVQGMPTLSRVVRYALSADGRRITSGAVLERGQPTIDQPTTGTIVGNRFYYIANPQYARLDNRTSALAPQAGTPVRTVIRVIELRP